MSAELFQLVGKFVFDNTEGKQQMEETTQTGKDMESKFNNSLKKIGTAVAGAFAVDKLKQFGQDCIEANSVQEQAELKLTTVMKQRMNATDDQIKSVENLASAQQNLGVVGDEVQLSGAQQLATFLDTGDALETLIPAMNNLAVQQNGCNVTSESMVSIGNMFGKVMQGQTSALSRVGITFTEAQEEALKYGTEEERAATLAQVITDNVGNMNEVFAQTDDGKIQQAKNTFSDLKEEIGAKLVPVQARLYEELSKVASFAVEHIIPAMEKTGQFISEHKPLIEALAVVIGVVTTALTIQAGVQAVKTAMNAAEVTSLTGLIAAKMADAAATMAALAPYLLIAAAIAAVIAVGVLLYQNWDTIKEKAGELKNKIVEVWNSIKAKTSEVWNGIKSTISSVVNGIKSTVTSVFNGVKEAITHPIETAKSVVSGILDRMKALFHFTWELPKIKLPHFSVSGEFSLNPPSIPHFGIDWYAKAMNDPMLLTQPTAFGVGANGIRVGGEAGDEVVGGKEKIQTMIAEAVAANNAQLVDKMSAMLDIMQQYMPQMARTQVVLDTGAMVGELADPMDQALGSIRKWKGQ